MLWDYRSEKWWRLISDILQKALNCAYLSANVQDYVTLSLEILGEHTTISTLDKTRVFHNLSSVLKVSKLHFLNKFLLLIPLSLAHILITPYVQ